MNPVIYRLLNPFHSIFALNVRALVRLKYLKSVGQPINLSAPKMLHEKIFWMELYTDTSMWSKLTDKYEVRDFVTQRVGGQYLNELYGVYDSVDTINYETLPKAFILKTTNGCTSYMIVEDKEHLNRLDVKKAFSFWLKFHYGDLTAQPHYEPIQPRIIAEKLLRPQNDGNDMLTDFKFYCFNGVPLYCNVFTQRQTNSHRYKRMIYDMNWNKHPELYDSKIDAAYLIDNFSEPICFDEMKMIAAKLSKGFPFVRVDLYDIDGKPVFGEMTFTPGIDTHYTLEFQRKLGDMIDLSLCEPKKD